MTLCTQPVVIDFTANWCGPCQGMAPVFASVAVELKDRAKFVKVDTDTTSLSIRFGVRSIPTFVVLYNDKVIDVAVGVRSKAQFSNWVAGVLDRLQPKS